MANKYQWQRLGMPFHPAESDIISVLRCVKASERISFQELLPSVMLNEIANTILKELLTEF